MMKDVEGLSHFTKRQLDAADNALHTWSQFLIDRAPHPGRFEQHLLPLDAIESFSGGDLPANINRYFLRTADIDAVQGETTAFVYSKIGKFIILGFIDVAYPRQWVGTNIHVREGLLKPGEYTLPKQFGDYLIHKARRFASIHAKISDRQLKKIDETARNNLDRIAKSSSFEAMRHDVRLFGSPAFEIHQRRDN